jgi:hypothetical protein
MEQIIILNIFIVVSLQILIFILGIFIGKHNFVKQDSSILNTKKGKNQEKHKITIDDKKIVLDIDTKKLEKKFDNLTEETIIETDISESISKLKNMKG